MHAPPLCESHYQLNVSIQLSISVPSHGSFTVAAKCSPSPPSLTFVLCSFPKLSGGGCPPLLLTLTLYAGFNPVSSFFCLKKGITVGRLLYRTTIPTLCATPPPCPAFDPQLSPVHLLPRATSPSSSLSQTPRTPAQHDLTKWQASSPPTPNQFKSAHSFPLWGPPPGLPINPYSPFRMAFFPVQDRGPFLDAPYAVPPIKSWPFFSPPGGFFFDRVELPDSPFKISCAPQ